MLNQSLKLALKHHLNQQYGNKPYFYHLVRVYLETLKYTEDEEILSLALLHDTLEDTNILRKELREISEYMPLYVKCLTKGKSKDYYKSCSMYYQTALVKAADRICNIKECIKHNDKEQFQKYYRDKKKFRILYPKLPNKMKVELELLYLKGLISTFRIALY